MKIVGTITEYNPFHNGHLYHLQEIKRQSQCDCLIVCLSTYFTMRGELSVHDPFTKTKYALSEADLVVALPASLAVNSADIFAYNAVRELNKLKVSELYIGSESDNPAIFEEIETIFIKNEAKIKEALKKGHSYKKALADICDISPNDLLGYSYYKAIKKLKANIKIKTIKRIGDSHGTKEAQDQKFTSSSALRVNPHLMANYTPNFVSNDILNFESLFPYLKYKLLISSSQELAEYQFLTEGIGSYLKKQVRFANSFKELLELCKSKRYTSSRIRRSLFYVLFQIKNTNYEYPYTRILGINNKGKSYLNKIKKEIMILTNNKPGLNFHLDCELIIAETLDLIFNQKNFQKEICKPIVIE